MTEFLLMCTPDDSPRHFCVTSYCYYHLDEQQRKVETAKPHPLTGVVTKRINLFTELAGSRKGGSRPARTANTDDLYQPPAAIV